MVDGLYLHFGYKVHVFIHTCIELAVASFMFTKIH